jgi:hypothetical protein
VRIVRDETTDNPGERENVRFRGQGTAALNLGRCKLRAASAPNRHDPCDLNGACAVEENAVRSELAVRLTDAVREPRVESEARNRNCLRRTPRWGTARTSARDPPSAYDRTGRSSFASPPEAAEPIGAAMPEIRLSLNRSLNPRNRTTGAS